MPSAFKCLHANCNSKKHKALGYCGKHYQQMKLHGKTFVTTQKDFNEVVDRGSHYELVLLSLKMKEVGRAKIDKEDLKKIKAVGRWSLNVDGYVFNSVTNTMMHRLVMDASSCKEVDHKNTKIEFRQDNRKSNLRIATRSQNSFNKSKPKNNTSGYKGICWDKPRKKWRVRITVKGKTINIGYFGTIQQAIEIYILKAKQLHKEFIHSSLGYKTTQAIKFYYAPGQYKLRKARE